jgi:hypothetical protein
MTTKRLSKIFSHFVPPSNGPTSPASAKASNGVKAKSTKAAGNNDSKTEENLPEEKELPTFDELPMFKNMPGCAWSLWGEKDQLGTVNLLTEEVVARAAKEEIKYGFNSIF